MPRIDIEALEDEWEDAERDEAPRSRKLSVAARRRIDELDPGRVVAVDRGRVTVLYRDEVAEAALAGTMRGVKAAVGDHVRVRAPRHAGDRPRIVELLPRESVLVRTGDDTDEDERVVVANADQVVVVLAADHLDTGARLLDRVMVAAAAGGLTTAVCVNKSDVIDDQSAVRSLLARYDPLGVPGVATSALTGAGVADLGRLLAGRWSAFAGHSGVGKSSLFNRLVPEANHAVAEVGRHGGRHTTVASRALRVDSLDAWLVDTPGVRAFGLGVVDPRDLSRTFPELADLSCDLADCLHVGEPGCDLPNAAIDPQRLASYRRLLAAVRGEHGDDES